MSAQSEPFASRSQPVTPHNFTKYEDEYLKVIRRLDNPTFLVYPVFVT